MTHVFTDYLEEVFNPELFQRLVPRALEKARKIHETHPYDAIAFTGTSGCSIGFILGYTLNIPIICIRKPDQQSHYKSWCCEELRSFEGWQAAKRYLIVDDGVCSGATVERIMEAISVNCENCRCVAMMMFHYGQSDRTYMPKDKTLARQYEDGIPIFSCRKNSDT
jgi:adenine/guanine phosphoribosyltransferase-like PRPP-binding protein